MLVARRRPPATALAVVFYTLSGGQKRGGALKRQPVNRRLGLEERDEAGGGEMLVVGEDFSEAEAAHNGEGDAVDDAGVAGAALIELSPAFSPIVLGWDEQTFVSDQSRRSRMTSWRAGRRETALPHSSSTKVVVTDFCREAAILLKAARAA